MENTSAEIQCLHADTPCNDLAPLCTECIEIFLDRSRNYLPYGLWMIPDPCNWTTISENMETQRLPRSFDTWCASVVDLGSCPLLGFGTTSEIHRPLPGL